MDIGVRNRYLKLVDLLFSAYWAAVHEKVN